MCRQSWRALGPAIIDTPLFKTVVILSRPGIGDELQLRIFGSEAQGYIFRLGMVGPSCWIGCHWLAALPMTHGQTHITHGTHQAFRGTLKARAWGIRRAPSHLVCNTEITLFGSAAVMSQ